MFKIRDDYIILDCFVSIIYYLNIGLQICIINITIYKMINI